MPISKKENKLISASRRIGSASTLLVVTIVVMGTVVSGAMWFADVGSHDPHDTQSDHVESDETDSGHAREPVLSAAPDAHAFPVIINQPAGPPRIDTGETDLHGNAVTVACATCHSARQPNFENKTVADLNEFHGSLAFNHGTISCLACHNSNDYNALKLADGTRVEFSNVMTLCAQCHGQQMTAFNHGAHGGMNGYWDRSRGPQTKNNCIDCHNPHAPKFPHMQPTFKPRDRFLEKSKH